MVEVRKILLKLTLLAIDILLHCIEVTRKIVLPGKKRKGNLLSSIFLLYVGTLESLYKFEHQSFRMSAILKKKYVRTGLMLIAGLLLILSSFEKSIDQQTFSGNEYYHISVEKKEQTANNNSIQQPLIQLRTVILSFPLSQNTYNHFSGQSFIVAKLFLAYHNLRI